MGTISPILSPQLQKKLMDAGLSKVQAQSATAKICSEVFMPDDCKVLVEEAWLQAKAANNLVNDLSDKHEKIRSRIDAIAGTITEIANAKSEYGIESFDERAKNALCMYSAILDMNKKIGVTGDASVDAASYCVYAYLGGQAKREITFNEDSEKHEQLYAGRRL